MFKKIISFFKEEEGAGLAEYALLLVLIALLVIASLGPLGTAIAKAFEKITAELTAGTV